MASARDHRIILRIHPNVSVKKPSGCRFGNKCVFTHKEADDQFSKKAEKAKKMKVQFSKNTLLHVKIRKTKSIAGCGPAHQSLAVDTSAPSTTQRTRGYDHTRDPDTTDRGDGPSGQRRQQKKVWQMQRDHARNKRLRIHHRHQWSQWPSAKLLKCPLTIATRCRCRRLKRRAHGVFESSSGNSFRAQDM